jgi:YHS domain-containing protein
MKQTLTFAALVAVAFVLGACAGRGDATVAPTAAATSQTSPGATATATASAAAPVSSFKETAKADPATVTPYPFTTCAVIRKDLEGSPKYRRVYKNQEVLFCCTPCLKAFDTNPEPYMPRIIEAAAAKARGETVNSGW